MEDRLLEILDDMFSTLVVSIPGYGWQGGGFSDPACEARVNYAVFIDSPRAARIALRAMNFDGETRSIGVVTVDLQTFVAYYNSNGKERTLYALLEKMGVEL